MILHVLIAMFAGWLQRHQQQTIAYLLEGNRALKAHLGGRRLRFTDTERRVAALAHPVRSKYLRLSRFMVYCASHQAHSTEFLDLTSLTLGEARQYIRVLMEHGNDARFLAFTMYIEDVMMPAMADEHVRIVRRERARDDAPLRDRPKLGLQHTGIAPLLPCSPLPQRIPGDLLQVTFGVGCQFIGQRAYGLGSRRTSAKICSTEPWTTSPRLAAAIRGLSKVSS
jgi:hypothetical protein